MLNKIWEWIKNLDLKTIIISIIEFLIFLFILTSVNNCNQEKIEKLDQNLTAARDSVEQVILINGNILSERDAYIVKTKQLEEVLKITKEERKDIEKKLNDRIAYISKIESNIRVDTLEVRDTVTVKDSSTISINFNYKDEWLKFSGGTYYKNGKSKTQIFDINIQTPLKVGLTDEYTIFVESENPYLNITNIEGAVIDGSSLRPNKKHWNFSLHAGIGVHYGLFGRQVDVGPYIGGGISYNF